MNTESIIILHNSVILSILTTTLHKKDPLNYHLSYGAEDDS